jgi:hypothetical protein
VPVQPVQLLPEPCFEWRRHKASYYTAPHRTCGLSHVTRHAISRTRFDIGPDRSSSSPDDQRATSASVPRAGPGVLALMLPQQSPCAGGAVQLPWARWPAPHSGPSAVPVSPVSPLHSIGRCCTAHKTCWLELSKIPNTAQGG